MRTRSRLSDRGAPSRSRSRSPERRYPVAVTGRKRIVAIALWVAALAAVGAAALVVFGFRSGGGPTATNAAGAGATGCPAGWLPAYQRLANRIHADVYCPTWMPSPLTGEIGPNVSFAGSGGSSLSVSADRSYLALFVWAEASTHDEVHVNLRGYPGRTAVPSCVEQNTNQGKIISTTVPCFADPRGTVTANGITATVYTVNQDADLWHVLYAWRHDGGLYTVSQHLAAPLTYAKVVQSLNRILAGLVLVHPATAG